MRVSFAAFGALTSPRSGGILAADTDLLLLQVMSELKPAEVHYGQYGGSAQRLGDAKLRPVQADLVFRLCRS